MSAPTDDLTKSTGDPAEPGNPSSFPTAALVGVFVAVLVLALAFLACGITRSRQQRRRQQMYQNHQAFYEQNTPAIHPHLNKPLPSQASANPYDTLANPPRFGTTTEAYSTYSSGGGPPVFAKDGEAGIRGGTIEVPPPAYEPQRRTENV